MKVLLATNNFSYYFKDLFGEVEVANPSNKYKDEYDLLVFTGGEDVNPRLYGENPVSSVTFSDTRDLLERKVFALFREGAIKAKKVLGVCRGIQILNVMLGGSLYQDLASVQANHSSVHDISWVDGVEGPLSEISVVNSLHHQAVRYFGDTMKATTLGKEPKTGVIESVLWGDNILGVQFHPEFFAPSSVQRKLFLSAMEGWVSGEPLLNLKRGSTRPSTRVKLSGNREVDIDHTSFTVSASTNDTFRFTSS